MGGLEDQQSWTGSSVAQGFRPEAEGPAQLPGVGDDDQDCHEDFGVGSQAEDDGVYAPHLISALSR